MSALNFLNPLASPADADAAFFALVDPGNNTPIAPGFVRVVFDSGFNGQLDDGKKCYFYIKPNGTAKNPTPVFADGVLQDCNRSVDVVTRPDRKEKVDLLWNLTGGSWWFIGANRVEYELAFRPEMDGTEQSLQALIRPQV